jgi:YbbR domain-containing protein
MALQDLFIKDIGWKIFSLVLALAIWLTVHNILQESEPPLLAAEPQPVIKTFTDVPVLIVSAAADVRQFHVTPDTVAVSVSGQRDVMEGVQVGRIHALVNLTDFNADHEQNQPVEVSTPPGVTLVSMEPAEVSVVVPPQKNK